MKRTIFILALALYSLNSISQQIIAPTVAEWNSKEKLSSEYKYNSVSVFLINGTKLEQLFTGENLPKEERKKINLKKKDYPKFLYLYLNLEDPLKKADQLTFPLYLIDARDKDNITYSEKLHGKVIDELSDDVLGTRSLIATGNIKTIKGNETAEFLETTYGIATDLFETAAALAAGPLGTPQIIEAVKKGGDYIKKFAQEKTLTNDFPVPLLVNEKPNQSYTLVSASLQQIKWTVSPSIQNPWIGLSDNPTKENLVSGLNANSPYLLIVRYKSKYVIPSDMKTIEISQDYIDERANLYSKLVGYEMDMEMNLMHALKTAVSFKADFELNKRMREVNKAEDPEAINRMISAYYSLKAAENIELLKHEGNKPRKEYYEEKYGQAYKQIIAYMNECFNSYPGHQKFVNNLIEASSIKDLSKLNKEALYEHIQKLDYYRDFVTKITNENINTDPIINTEVFALNQKTLDALESELYKQAFNVSIINSIDEKKKFLEIQSGSYKDCDKCKTSAAHMMEQLQISDNNAKKQELLVLKNNQYLGYFSCFEAIVNVISDSLKSKFPDVTRLDGANKVRYEYCDNLKHKLLSEFKEFFTLSALNIDAIPLSDVPKMLSRYNLVIKEFKDGYGSLLLTGIISEVPNANALLNKS